MHPKLQSMIQILSLIHIFPKGYITQKEIQAAQRYYWISRTVTVHTYKAQGDVYKRQD